MVEGLFSGLLLPLGVALGWALARKAPATTDSGQPLPPALGGLIRDLAEDDPDRALASLTQTDKLDPAAAELHLSIGNLFRKRGEVDRALRVHEALAAREGLAPALMAQVHFELAQDYLKAGVMDRAEALLTGLATQGEHAGPALELLVGLYEQSRDWSQAIATAQKVETIKGESRRAVISQYWCELASEARADKNLETARQHATRAAREHKTCVRANLLLGEFCEKAGETRAALGHYRAVLDQDPRFLAEVIEPLRRCYLALGDAAGFDQFLRDAKEQTPSSLPWLSEAQRLREQGQDAMSHLAEGLEQRPSRAVLAEFLAEMEQRPEVLAAGLAKPAASLKSALRKMMDAAPGYQCSHCGFTPRQLFWQCPSCKQWGSTAPVSDALKLS